MKEQNYYNEEGNICEASVRKNIVLAELGKPLTMPLSILNENCDFKKKWDEIQTKWHGEPIMTNRARDRKSAYQKAYNQRPEVKARQKVYIKAHRQRPEVKARYEAYQKAYYQRMKLEKQNGKVFKPRNHSKEV